MRSSRISVTVRAFGGGGTSGRGRIISSGLTYIFLAGKKGRGNIFLNSTSICSSGVAALPTAVDIAFAFFGIAVMVFISLAGPRISQVPNPAMKMATPARAVETQGARPSAVLMFDHKNTMA